MNCEELFLSDYIMENLDTIAKQEGFQEYNVGNYSQPNIMGLMSNMVRVVIQGKRAINGCTKEDKIHLICKYPSTNPIRRAKFDIVKQFDREIYMFNHVLPALTKFQKDKGLSDEDGFFVFPKCYVAAYSKESNEHIIILDDLANDQYKVSNYEMNLNIDHCRIVLKNLAKLHAISFAIRDHNPDLLNKFKVNLADLYVPYNTKSATMKQSFHYSFDHAIKSLQSHELTEIAKLKEIQANFAMHLEETVNIEASEPFGVVNHGECWNKNILFQYDQTNTPQKMCFLDFQLARYGSPALDIVFYILNSTTSDFRKMYYNELIKFYYDNLVKTLELLGSDAEKLISFENLKEQLTKFGKFASILSSISIQLLTCDQSLFQNMDSFSETFGEISISNNGDVFEGVNLCNQYNEHMRGIVKDSIKYGYY